MKDTDEVKVWDPFVRLFHWALVSGFLICYITEGKPRWLHVNTGYAIGTLVVLRVFWGFLGPRHARFSDFVRSPRAVMEHLRDVALFRAKRFMGHDPAGGAMIVAMLIVMSLTVLSGMLVYGARDKAGPFGRWTAEIRTAIPSLEHTAHASRDGKERKHGRGQSGKEAESEWLEEFHEVMANVALTLAIIHVCGVVAVSVQTRENLILGMITGRKKRMEGRES